MINISYALSSKIQLQLEELEILKRKVLLFPMNPKKELELAWQRTVEKVYYPLYLSGNPLKKDEVGSLLLKNAGRRRISDAQREAFGFKKTLDEIKWEWTWQPDKQIHSRDITLLNDIVRNRKVVLPEREIEQILTYIQSSHDHPLIQAAVAFVSFLKLNSVLRNTDPLSHIALFVFLHKDSWDGRGLLVPQEIWARERQDFSESLGMSVRAASVNVWIEYFVRSMKSAFENLLINMEHYSSAKPPDHMLIRLSSRQKEILGYLEKPDLSITNREAQRMFGISQITASRDLSKLERLGLIFSRGGGRSTKYSKF